MPDAGWYRDPQDASVEEYWDGQTWSGQRRPSTESQPAYGRPTQQIWGQRPAYGSQPNPVRSGFEGYDAASYGPHNQAPAPSSRRKRTPFLIAGVLVIVLVAAGVVTFVLRSGSSAPKITYDGQEIASAAKVLSTSEKAVKALVSRDHGAKSDDTRCYYAQPVKPADGAKASDVIDSLRCGPLLFTDGNVAKQYVTIPLDADTSGKQVRLTPETTGLSATSLTAVPKSLTLVRPDDDSAPSGNGGLTVPKPPPAQKGSIVAAQLSSGDTPALVLESHMISKTQDVTVLGAGYVQRYGSGLAARSAPDGQRLLAFQISTGEGAIGAGGAAPTLVVDGTSQSIPAAFGEQWDVAAVPTGSNPVIQLVADGFTQTLSLPGGDPGSRNISVLTRSNTIGIISKSFMMRSTFSKSGASRKDKLNVTADSAALYFWSPTHPEDHPSSPSSAYLSIDLTYKDSAEPGKTIGFDPSLLRLTLPGGNSVRPRNLAGTGHVYNVFTVPADFTTGTLVIGGSGNLGHGLHQSISTSKHLAVHISNG